VGVAGPLLFLSCVRAWHGVAVDGVVVGALVLLVLPFLLVL
jgi:hypothetical protein